MSTNQQPENAAAMTAPDEATLEAERCEADAPHRADRPSTPEERTRADEAKEALGPALADGAAHEGEMSRRGASQTGEGRVP